MAMPVSQFINIHKLRCHLIHNYCYYTTLVFVFYDFITLTQVHNFTVSAQDIHTFRRLSVFTLSFTGILQLLNSSC